MSASTTPLLPEWISQKLTGRTAAPRRHRHAHAQLWGRAHWHAVASVCTQHFSSALLAAIRATLAAPLKRLRAPAERESTGRWDRIQPLPHPPVSRCSRSLKANLSCRAAVSFSTCLWGLCRPAAARRPFGPGERWASARRRGEERGVKVRRQQEVKTQPAEEAAIDLPPWSTT